jgi:hypothetical protein
MRRDMTIDRIRVARWGCAAFAASVLLLAAVAALAAGRARAAATVECQHPVMTGVEVYKLRHVTSRGACPVALALFRWETNGRHERQLYGCHGIGHPFLRLRTFRGWQLALTPDFVMSRGRASFAVGGTDFPINCT